MVNILKFESHLVWFLLTPDSPIIRSKRFAMRLKLLLLFLLTGLLLSGCRPDDDNSLLDEELDRVLTFISGGAGRSFFRMPASGDYASIPQDPKNPITKTKVDLGRLLFHETGLGLEPAQAVGQGRFSCASCHFASAGFQAGRFQGIGEGGIGFGINGEGRMKDPEYQVIDMDVQPIRSPAALNTAFQELMLWNGQFGSTGMNIGTEYTWSAGTPKENNHLGFHGVETQAIAGLKVHRLKAIREFIENTGYKPMYDAAFPEVPEQDRYSAITTGLAIAAYERTLLANESPWQQWLRGKSNAMSDAEKAGAILFFGKALCGSCHTGPALNSMSFHALGMKSLRECPEPVFKVPVEAPEDLGRGGFTGRGSDMYKFKTPQLYNLADSPFYGHGASFRTIREVVEYKNRAVPENPDVPPARLDPAFIPLGLTDAEITEIATFLAISLRDPNLKRYQPDRVLSGQCFPFNDPLARAQLGCD